MSAIFTFAADLAREQAANTRFEIAQRRMLESFAAMRTKHRAERVDLGYMDERSQSEMDAEALALFDRAEARAINNGFN